MFWNYTCGKDLGFYKYYFIKGKWEFGDFLTH